MKPSIRRIFPVVFASLVVLVGVTGCQLAQSGRVPADVAAAVEAAGLTASDLQTLLSHALAYQARQ
jgi:hypothetical protein